MNDLDIAPAPTASDIIAADSATLLPFFVYGTLRNGQGNYYGRLIGRTIREETCTASGFLMLGRKSQFPFALPAAEDYAITGELMWINPDLYGQVMESMDDLEGYEPGRAWNLYDRKIVTVQTANGPVKAWMYISTFPVEYFIENDCPIIGSGDWFDAK